MINETLSVILETSASTQRSVHTERWLNLIVIFVYFLPPANEVCEGYVFTGVRLSRGGLCPGGFSPRGVSVQRGFCPGGSVQAGLCPGVSVR